jgi:hypothetical protein
LSSAEVSGAAALLKQSKFAYLNREYHAIRQV